MTIPLEFDIPGEKMGWDVQKELKWIDRHKDKLDIDVNKQEVNLNITDENKPKGGEVKTF